VNEYICLDSSVIIKILTWEEKSEEAVKLFNRIIENDYTVIVPDFAWAEIGSVLRKKVRYNMLKVDEAKILWESFIEMDNIQFISYKEICKPAWEISNSENLPTLYDAAFLAVCEVFNISEFWTADEKLINSIAVNKNYIRKL
jgi:predicted nucleic acid-binding protein